MKLLSLALIQFVAATMAHAESTNYDIISEALLRLKAIQPEILNTSIMNSGDHRPVIGLREGQVIEFTQRKSEIDVGSLQNGSKRINCTLSPIPDMLNRLKTGEVSKFVIKDANARFVADHPEIVLKETNEVKVKIADKEVTKQPRGFFPEYRAAFLIAYRLRNEKGEYKLDLNCTVQASSYLNRTFAEQALTEAHLRHLVISLVSGKKLNIKSFHENNGKVEEISSPTVDIGTEAAG